MTDEHDKSGDAPSDDESQAPLAGERLAEARRAQQIPVVDIAKELHLDEYKVRALEKNDFDVIGAPVFAKGHLRKYAQLVQVSEADVMADYYQLNRSGAPPVVSIRPKLRKEISPGPWIVAFLVFAVLATAYWWFGVRELPAPERPTGEIAPLPAVEDDGGRGQEQTSLPDGSADDPAIDRSTDAAMDSSADVAQQPAADSLPVAGSADSIDPDDESDSRDLRLTVSFSGDSWTEITDANGRRLFFGLGSDGRTVNLSGEAPFNVLFGNAANVSLQVNGEAFEIPAASRRGRTARLTLNGQ